jgi:hypothetical protein
LKRIMLIALLFCTTLISGGLAANSQPAQLTTLKEDSGINISDMNITFVVTPTYGYGQTVKFSPPRSGWKLKLISLLATDGWNFSTNEEPKPLPFTIEVRDSNLRLLYHYADIQLPYFTHSGKFGFANVEIPDLPLRGDFFVCFYGYQSVALAAELQNATGNSYLFDKIMGDLYNGTIQIGETQGIPVNWLIRVEGE